MHRKSLEASEGKGVLRQSNGLPCRTIKSAPLISKGNFPACRTALIALSLGACGQVNTLSYAITTDRETGCQYISVGSGITPRISSDGKTHMGCREGAGK
jgi:hypothetical protein